MDKRLKRILDGTGKLYGNAPKEDVQSFIKEHLDGKNIDGKDVVFRSVGPVGSSTYGNRLLGLHSELAYMPQAMPRYVCLYCNSPAHLGGQIILASTRAAWEKVKETRVYENHRKKFEARSRPYRLARNFPKHYLMDVLGKTTEEEVLALSTDKVKIHPSMDCNYFTVRSELSFWVTDKEGNEHFSNYFHAAAFSPEVYGLDYGFTEEEAEEIEHAIYLSSIMYNCKHNDVLIIDNYKWMHGRLPYFDNQRDFDMAFIY